MSRGIIAKAATCMGVPSDRKRSATPRWSSSSMVRACRPPAREPSTSCVMRRSTTATSTPASLSSAASIRPVGPPPATTTECWVALFAVTAADCPALSRSCRKPRHRLYLGSGGNARSDARGSHLDVSGRWAPLSAPPRCATRPAQESEPLRPQLLLLAVVERRQSTSDDARQEVIGERRVACEHRTVQVRRDDVALDQPVASAPIAITDAFAHASQRVRIRPEHRAPAVVLVAGQHAETFGCLRQQLADGALARQPVGAAVDQPEAGDHLAGTHEKGLAKDLEPRADGEHRLATVDGT